VILYGLVELSESAHSQGVVVTEETKRRTVREPVQPQTMVKEVRRQETEPNPLKKRMKQETEQTDKPTIRQQKRVKQAINV